MDATDGAVEEVEEQEKMCNYVVIDSHDALLINLTPRAMDVIMDVAEVRMLCYYMWS